MLCGKTLLDVAVLAVCLAAHAALAGAIPEAQAPAASEAGASPGEASATRALGTIKSVSGNIFVLTADMGGEMSVIVEATTKLLRVEPGEKDLKRAVPLALSELRPGDRILVRGVLAENSRSMRALSLIAMKHEDIAQKRAREREEWQKHGVGGLVQSVDAANGRIVITTYALGQNVDLSVHVTKQTILRRYAPNSVKFDEAKAAPIGEIQPGDQLRARRARNADGNELTAEEIVSGTFRNIAGTIAGIDASAGTLTVLDLTSKSDVAVRITSETQMRKLPPFVAQRIAMRLKGEGHGAPEAAGPKGPGAARPGEGMAARVNGEEGGGFDLQRMLNRMPVTSLADLQKGGAVMIVATQGARGAETTAITLLSGVEPILEASPKGGREMVLSPWSLGTGGPEGGADTP